MNIAKKTRLGLRTCLHTSKFDSAQAGTRRNGRHLDWSFMGLMTSNFCTSYDAQSGEILGPKLSRRHVIYVIDRKLRKIYPKKA